MPQIEMKRQPCFFCSKLKRHTMTNYTCETCVDSVNVPIGLCIEPCFKKWHGSLLTRKKL